MRRLAVLLTLASACGVPDLGEPAEGGEESSTSNGSSATAETPPNPGTGTTGQPETGSIDDGETTTDGSGTDGSGTDGTDTDDDPASVCDPQPMNLGPFALALDWNREDPFLDQTIELDVPCTVSSIASAAGELEIDLACEDAPHVLDVSELGPIDLAEGDAVTLRVLDAQPWWRQTYIALLRDGQVIVAGMSGESLPQGDGSSFDPPSTFFDPLGIAVVPDVCRPEPLPEPSDEPCNFLCEEPCYQIERQALEVTSGGQSVVIHDGNQDSLDGLQIAVFTAQQYLNVRCSDTPGGWRQLVVMRTL